MDERDDFAIMRDVIGREILGSFLVTFFLIVDISLAISMNVG